VEQLKMTFDLSLSAIVLALVIFLLRVFNNAIGTVRVVLITRDMRFGAAVLGFIEALTFAVVISSVVKDLGNFLNLTAYCLGFSVGGYVGMAIEARFVTSYMIANVISKESGHEIALALREKGYGVTEINGSGRDGDVQMLQSIIARRDVPDVVKIVRSTCGDAFVSLSEVRSLERGWLRRGNQPR
jgi:uncharacterized protein YebE (UPF0316 family)